MLAKITSREQSNGNGAFAVLPKAKKRMRNADLSVRSYRFVVGNRLYAAACLAAAFLFLGLALTAAWIPVKAELAQWLIERSWRSGGRVAPWPWADTRPAAVLEAPAHGVRLLVLEGNSSRNLAFGPVFSDGTARVSDMVINGHRDTHFDFLRQLKPGDRLSVERPWGAMQYEVTQTDVVDSTFG